MSELYNAQEEKKLVFRKNIECTNCGEKFEDIRVLNSKLRRLESDDDLRPRFQNIDSLKYGVTACPYCGYAAQTKNFEKMTKLQKQLLNEKISSKFVTRTFEDEDGIINYPTAIEQYKMALLCYISMDYKLSDQAYLCLQLSWLIRGYLEDAAGQLSKEEEKQLTEDQERFYRQAYDGLSKAALQEEFPICGMDESTYNYLLAVLSFKYKEYDYALKYCGSIVQTRGVNAKIKDKALMLKDEVAKAKKAESGEEE